MTVEEIVEKRKQWLLDEVWCCSYEELEEDQEQFDNNLIDETNLIGWIYENGLIKP